MVRGIEYLRALSRARNRRWRKRHPDKVKSQQKKYSSSHKGREAQKKHRDKNKKRLRDYHKAWRSTKKGKESTRDYALRRNYGISLKDYKRMAREQTHKCLICSRRKKLDVDHIHGTKIVCGLLCRRCNLMIGTASSEVLAKAALYKKARHESQRKQLLRFKA